MATTKEIKEHLAIALNEIGKIVPWFDDEFKVWVFSHPNYPVEYDGITREEVIKNYPKYLKDFIKYRLDDRLAPHKEKITKGHGGKREGAGRPKGSTKEPKIAVYLPENLGKWIKIPANLQQVQNLRLKSI